MAPMRLLAVILILSTLTGCRHSIVLSSRRSVAQGNQAWTVICAKPRFFEIRPIINEQAEWGCPKGTVAMLVELKMY